MGGIGQRRTVLGLLAGLLCLCGLDAASLPLPFRNLVTPLPAFYSGSIEWGDFDNDGYLDLLFAGGAGGGSFVAVYRNSGRGTFQRLYESRLRLFAQPARLFSRWFESAFCGDSDNDGARPAGDRRGRNEDTAREGLSERWPWAVHRNQCRAARDGAGFGRMLTGTAA